MNKYFIQKWDLFGIMSTQPYNVNYVFPMAHNLLFGSCSISEMLHADKV